WGYWIFFIGFNLLYTYVVYLRFSTREATDFMTLIMNLFIAFFVSKLFVIFILFGEDLARAGVALFRLVNNSFIKEESTGRVLPGRRKVVCKSALILAAVPFATFLYGMVKGKHQFTVHRITLYFADLPDAFDGLRIAQLSVFHAGSF